MRGKRVSIIIVSVQPPAGRFFVGLCLGPVLKRVAAATSSRRNGERAGMRGFELKSDLASSPRPTPPLREEWEKDGAKGYFGKSLKNSG